MNRTGSKRQTAPNPRDPVVTSGEAGARTSQVREGQARLFVTLWVMAFSAHYFESRPFDAWPVILAGLPCLIFPGSVAAFTTFLIAGTGVAVLHLPAASNHIVLALLIHLVLAGAAAVVFLGKPKPSREDALPDWIAQAVTPCTAVLLVVYFFGVFHKLNTSFFDPGVSCAGRLLYQGLRLQGLTVGLVPEGAIFVGAVLTVMAEAAILLLIAVPRTREWGVLLGVSFHFLLAWAKFYDFSTFVFALYVLVLPVESAAAVPRMQRWRRLGIGGWLLFGLVSVGAYLSGEQQSPVGLTWHTLQVSTWALAVGAIIVPLLFANFTAATVPRAWDFKPAWLMIFPVLAFLNGAAPYLGFKTVASYSMFSNIRTEGGKTNHFLGAVESLHIDKTTTDTVHVFEVRLPSDPDLGLAQKAQGGTYWLRRQIRWANQGEPVRVPWIELRRAANLFKDAGIRNVFVKYSRHGRVHQVADAGSDPILSAPMPYVSKHLRAFRQIQQQNRPIGCRW